MIAEAVELPRMDMRRLVGRNAKRLRLAKGMTQEELAVATDLSQQYVSDLERGLRNPTVITLFHLATALGVEPAELLRAPKSRS